MPIKTSNIAKDEVELAKEHPPAHHHQHDLSVLNDDAIVDKTSAISTSPPTSISTEPIIPHERQVMNEIIKLWKLDPSNESLGNAKLHQLLKNEQPTWTISEKRLKTILKNNGLQLNAPNFYYANQITSTETPFLEPPTNVAITMTKSRGKCLFYEGKKPTSPKDLLWSEHAFILIPPLDHVPLIRKGMACAYCSKPLQTKIIKVELDCSSCPERWCSMKCKKKDSIHADVSHIQLHKTKLSKNLNIDSESWKKYEEYCLENQWNAAFALAVIYATIIKDPTGILEKQFKAMARVRQDIIYKALGNNNSDTFDTDGGGALFIQEQQEQLWIKGYELFTKIFILKDGSRVSYNDYMYGLGTFNINNIDGSIYLIQSHLNHNCEPNVDVQFIGRTLGIKVFAKREIKPSEELTTSYVNEKLSLNERRSALRINWGFNCTCKRCKKEEKLEKLSTEDIDKGIKELITPSKKNKKNRKSKSKSKNNKNGDNVNVNDEQSKDNNIDAIETKKEHEGNNVIGNENVNEHENDDELPPSTSKINSTFKHRHHDSGDFLIVGDDIIIPKTGERTRRKSVRFEEKVDLSSINE